MEVIILAAGRGERLMPLTIDTPKVLLPLWDGECILQKQLKVFEKIKEINRVIVVTGYLGEKIEDKVKEWGYGDFVTTVHNPFYKVSNNLISLWIGSLKSIEDIIVTNGDNMFKELVIRNLIDAGDSGVFLVVDEKESYDLDDMKVTIQDGRIVHVSKKIPLENTNAESTGIAKFAGDGKKKFEWAINMLVHNEEYLNKFWLEVFNFLAEHGENIEPVWIDEHDWQEMDIHSDKEIIDLLLRKKMFLSE